MSQKLLILHVVLMALMASLLVGAVLLVSSFGPTRNNNFTMWVHPEEVVVEQVEEWI